MFNVLSSNEERSQLISTYESVKEELCKLIWELETATPTITVALKTFESSKKRTLQGEVLFNDMEVAISKLEAEIKVAKADIIALERQETSVYDQLQLMEKGEGLSCWPKPILHPPCPIVVDSSISIQIHPCGFCKQWFHCFDLVLTM